MRAAALAVALLAASACGPNRSGVEVPGSGGRVKSSAVERASRRLFDGAPPVVPHGDLGAGCLNCHGDRGIEVAGLGFSPPNPHAGTEGLSDRARCRQCHVFRQTEELFVANAFQGLRQDLRHGRALHEGAPPVIPHAVFMRENCTACHAGPAAREEIRTPHPERLRCRQCHVEQVVTGRFSPAGS